MSIVVSKQKNLLLHLFYQESQIGQKEFYCDTNEHLKFIS